MTLKELATVHSEYLRKHNKYEIVYYRDFDYSVISRNTIYRYRRGRGSKHSVNDIIIGFDTETSKKPGKSPHNHIVAWTLSLRLYSINIATLWGTRPSEFIECLKLLRKALPGDDFYIYVHNLAYDWVFIRRYMINAFGEPIQQLNTKSHYPITITFVNGIILKDSLILAQRKLEKWAEDLDVEHKKAVGCWEYDKIRNQGEHFTKKELKYIVFDTLALVECIDKTRIQLNKDIYSMPYTATGIVREDIRTIGKQNGARDFFKRVCMDYDTYKIALQCYHGGYTHANREFIGETSKGLVKCYDFSSSYPYCMCSQKFPMGRFYETDNRSIKEILSGSEENAYMFKLILVAPELKTYDFPMPALQYSKCVKVINPVLDNGRILQADYIEIYLTDVDLSVIAEQYIYERAICTDVHMCHKDYLPKWLTDYIYKLFIKKTKLKGKDRVAYNMAKGKINSVYGVHVQKSIRDELIEDYDTGEYYEKENDPEKQYEKYLKSYNHILPYQWGVYVTSYAFRNLFTLGSCCDIWLYSDTDSCYGAGWNEDKVKAYNSHCKELLLKRGYGAVEHNDREYWLGIAEVDGEYKEFRSLGAKRYACRDFDDNLKITVAGVPKKSGVKCLNNDIDNFSKGFVFDGKTTGKLAHFYYYVDKEYIDEIGNETADSIDLEPCDYLLDDISVIDWDKLFEEEIEVTVYE